MPPTLVFGAGGIGETKSFTYTFEDSETVSALLETLKASSIVELDSAASYPPGNAWHAETLLGQVHAADKGFIIDSKVMAQQPGAKLDEETILKSVKETLRLLGIDKIRILYAHAPDPKTPIEQTIKGFVSVVEAGMAEGWGVCNYSAAQLQELMSCCEEKGYRKPVVAQDMYNLLYRKVENEVIPFCRKYGLKFYAFSPLAGGFLTGKVTFASDDAKELERTRWVGRSSYAWYIEKFNTPAMHDAIRNLYEAGSKEGVSVTEISLRWLMYHSALRDGDGIILGGKRLPEIEHNVEMARKGPLSESLLAAIEKVKAA